MGGNSDSQYWIAATAKKREEDQSKSSCTLFKFIPVNTAANTVRVMHVQSKCPLYLGTNRYLLANNHVFDGSSNDIFTIINGETLLDSNDTSDRNTWFRPVKVNDNTIALLTLRNNYFCKRLTADGKDNCLDACIPTITQEAQLLVEEPVMERQIQGVKYDLDNRRMLEETVMVMGEHTHKNSTPHSQFYEVKFSLQNTATCTWKANLSLKLGLKATLGVQLPLLVDGKTELSTELHAGYEFGKIYTDTSNMEFTHKVEVSRMSKMTAKLVSILGKYDIPFTYMQKDTLYNGKTVIYDVQDGTYTGSNFYNTRFEIKEVPLSS
ncbi:hypothetical protein V6Z11_D02G011300 [Gossypium hirsutum]|uniref:Agglutinin domain-containing protein n=1 Tax=Gossypium hirsutum TaxID=3635 RepID=A0A1U8PML8_GOSHI|nr:uncharacterized protein LOC107960603 [Gossypium hirsutum]